jgi:hypothetical protein
MKGGKGLPVRESLIQQKSNENGARKLNFNFFKLKEELLCQW